jgi:hypothetical protein
MTRPKRLIRRTFAISTPCHSERSEESAVAFTASNGIKSELPTIARSQASRIFGSPDAGCELPQNPVSWSCEKSRGRLLKTIHQPRLRFAFFGEGSMTDFAHRYRSMSDYELAQLAANLNVLVPEAREALRAEIARRPPPAASGLTQVENRQLTTHHDRAFMFPWDQPRLLCRWV